MKKTNWMRNNRNEYTNNTSNKNRETESRKKRKRQVKNGSVSSNMSSHMSKCTYRTYLTWASRNPSNKFTLTRNAVIQYFYLFSILSLLIFKWMQLRWCERVLRRARSRVCFFFKYIFSHCHISILFLLRMQHPYSLFSHISSENWCVNKFFCSLVATHRNQLDWMRVVGYVCKQPTNLTSTKLKWNQIKRKRTKRTILNCCKLRDYV